MGVSFVNAAIVLPAGEGAESPAPVWKNDWANKPTQMDPDAERQAVE